VALPTCCYVADGSAYLATPINPVFVLLALLNVGPQQVGLTPNSTASTATADLHHCCQPPLYYSLYHSSSQAGLPSEGDTQMPALQGVGNTPLIDPGYIICEKSLRTN